MKTIVRIPGTQVWVNPRYVTSVQAAYCVPSAVGQPDQGRTIACVTVAYEGNQAYRTKETPTLSSLSDVVAAINQG